MHGGSHDEAWAMRLITLLLLSLLVVCAVGLVVPWLADSPVRAGVTCVEWHAVGEGGPGARPNYTSQATGHGPSTLANGFYADRYRVSWIVPPDCTLAARVLPVDGWTLLAPAAFGYAPGAGSTSFTLDPNRYYVQVNAPCAWQLTLAPLTDPRQDR